MLRMDPSTHSILPALAGKAQNSQLAQSLDFIYSIVVTSLRSHWRSSETPSLFIRINHLACSGRSCGRHQWRSPELAMIEADRHLATAISDREQQIGIGQAGNTQQAGVLVESFTHSHSENDSMSRIRSRFQTHSRDMRDM